eukprot:CAMPEP_0202877346 /NCGR_PEP_ID=MMETSP1391-20130828/30511_1 /ASSEMBLY_ACC=CAM_ASM_000867 /TAXON_ID=1034604 /ORGANISM="Chlamydomonas leiostraca, Strain SAG 11-49" /LENGTH=172 /DNA_ID=CAMNT_0049559371 /DNA_START=715 /DNA_END=1230 /DNA_ORIENTATION=-
MTQIPAATETTDSCPPVHTTVHEHFKTLHAKPPPDRLQAWSTQMFNPASGQCCAGAAAQYDQPPLLPPPPASPIGPSQSRTVYTANSQSPNHPFPKRPSCAQLPPCAAPVRPVTARPCHRLLRATARPPSHVAACHSQALSQLAVLLLETQHRRPARVHQLHQVRRHLGDHS